MPSQQGRAPTAAVGAGRELAQGHAGQHHRVRTPGRAARSRALERGRQAARESAIRVTVLGPQVDAIDRRREADHRRHHAAAPGVEGQPGAADGAPLAPTLREGSDRLKRGASQAPPVERVDMPQADGRQRPIGQPTLEDQSVQRAPVEGRHAIDANAWLGCSSGARPGRRPHHAVEAVTGGMDKRPLNGGLEAARRGGDEAMAHAWRVTVVAHRMGEQRVVRPSRTGLQAGGLEEGPWRPQEAGTPPGGRARPLLATLDLHDVVALGAAPWRRRHARGDVMSVRDGDEFMVGVQHQDDAEPLGRDRRERFHRVPLARHPDQTRLRAVGRWASARRQRRGHGQPETFDVLGCTPRGGPTTRGTCTVRRGPLAPRLRQTLQEVKQPRRARLHGPIETRGAWLKRVVRGHSRYEGVPRHRGRLWVFRERIRRDWCRT